MVNIFLFLALAFLFILVLGKLMEKIKVPWIFAGLIFGALLAIYNPFASITSDETFNFIAQLGMYFLLFIIGFEIDLDKFKKTSNFFIKATFFIIFLEAAIAGTFIHLVFHYSWFISFIVSLSFATVGEAILIPILQEFKIVNTKLGQSIIGIGTLDDVIELAVLIVVILMIGVSKNVHMNTAIILGSLIGLFFLTYMLTKFKNIGSRFNFLSIEVLFLFIIFILFLFLGLGDLAHATAIAALLAGLALKAFLPKERMKNIYKEVKTMCYGFFAPIFFVWVGTTMDMKYLTVAPVLIILLILISNAAKLLGSYIIGRKEFGLRKSILLGIGLSVRFSTSIIIIKLLLDNGLIDKDLYSIILASTIVFTFAIPLLFSYLLRKWGAVNNKIYIK